MHIRLYPENQKEPTERPVHKWENNIKIDIEDTEFEDVNRIYLSQK
jgi:hypothetical protein